MAANKLRFWAKPWRLLIILVALASMLAIIMAIITTRPYKILNLTEETAPTSFDPALVFDDRSFNIMGQIYEPLFQYHYIDRPFRTVPLLAQDFPEVLDEGKTYRLKIKKHVLYHHHPALAGPREVKAQDFILQIKRILFPPMNSPGVNIFANLLGRNEYQKAVGNDWTKIPSTPLEGLVAEDDHTLVIKLVRPDVQMMNYLTMNFIVPIPEEVWQAEKNDLSKVEIGTGPFLVGGVNNQEQLILQRFKEYRTDHYPGRQNQASSFMDFLSARNTTIPFLDEIHYYFTLNETLIWELFQNGKLDIITIPARYLPLFRTRERQMPGSLSAAKAQKRYFTGHNLRWLSFNMQDPLLGKNLPLRQAIAHALNLREYFDRIALSDQQAYSLFPPGILGHNPERRPPYEYNLAKAKNYMALAGHPRGEGLPAFTLSTRGKSNFDLNEAEFIKTSLAKIGIQINIEVLDFNEFLRRGRSGKLQFFVDNWFFDYPDPESILQLLSKRNYPGINKSGFKNDQVEELYQSLHQALSKEEKLQVVKHIEDIIFQEVPWIVLSYARPYQLIRSEIRNYHKSNFIHNGLKYVNRSWR